jgi:hypothetical protein
LPPAKIPIQSIPSQGYDVSVAIGRQSTTAVRQFGKNPYDVNLARNIDRERRAMERRIKQAAFPVIKTMPFRS